MKCVMTPHVELTFFIISNTSIDGNVKWPTESFWVF